MTNTVLLTQTGYSQHPQQTSMQFGVNTLQIVQYDRFTKELLVERQSKAAVQVVTMEDR